MAAEVSLDCLPHRAKLRIRPLAVTRWAQLAAVLKTDPTYTKFGHPVDWTWFELWHHEGRRARHGAAMMAPDYTHWHGLYEVAKHFYSKFIPELKEVAMKKDGNEEFATAMLDKHFKPIDGHAWYFEGMSKDAIDKVRKGFEDRYGKGSLD